MSEGDLMRSLQNLASKLGARLFRQQVGMAWTGKVERVTICKNVRVFPSDVVIRGARPFHAGITGMSDLGGWTPVKVTPEMLGTTLAVYTQVEVKLGTSVSKEQRAWIDAVCKAGGIAGVAKSEEDLKSILDFS